MRAGGTIFAPLTQPASTAALITIATNDLPETPEIIKTPHCVETFSPNLSVGASALHPSAALSAFGTWQILASQIRPQMAAFPKRG
ncbi:hypothetical protein [Croceicoccus naphthovorans]|uniref:hypothetical protein n=1 Tax=Croceicoccus naphthovorans TaxID=1348774 RepID=UPI001C54F63B|nr:hypothetical protein [Croceicoccus naphthovorans]